MTDGGGAAAAIVTLGCAVRVIPPPTPEIVKGKEPVTAVILTVKVPVEDVPVVLLGLKAMLVPPGSPEAPRFTVPAKPFRRLIVTA